MKYLSIGLIKVVFFSVFAISGYAQTTASALAIKEVKSLEIPFNFTKTFMANQNVSFIGRFNDTFFSDRVDSFISFNLKMIIDKKSVFTQEFKASINGTNCDNSPYSTQIGQTQYVVSFQCINAINSTLYPVFYNFTFSTDRDTDNILFIF